MKKNSRLVEETKNTNYKMHKSKKGWLVSYSLLTFMLGGIYLGSSASTPVKAAEVESQNDQKGVDQELQKSIDSKSVDDAKQNALTTIDTTATTAKAKINADKNLSSSAKSTQLKNIDAIVADAKDKVNKAEDLPAIKAILDDANISITNSYKPGTITASKKKSSAKKEPVVDMSKKPATNKKVGVSTYKGLSSFFRTSSDTAGITATSDKTSTTKTVKSEDNSSLVAGNQTGKTEASKLAPRAASTDSVTGQAVANTTADKKDTNQYTSQAEATPRVDTAADTTGDNSVTVGPDDDAGRPGFNASLDSKQNSPTSVNIPTPDQVLNPNNYKQKVANVATLADLATAWADSSVTYINITGDIAYDSKVTISNRAPGASVVVNGNGHTIELGSQTLSYPDTVRTNMTTVTVTNGVFKQGFNGAIDNDKSSLVYSSDGQGLNVNIDNVRLIPMDENSNSNPIHVVVAHDAKVTFSGTNYFFLTNEVTRHVTRIIFANNAKVEMDRSKNATAHSQFYFSDSGSAVGDAGYGKDGNEFIMGDGSTNIARTYNGSTANYPAIYLDFDKITVGDDVSWTQTGFQYFLNATQGSKGTGTFNFGQNFNLSAPITTMPGAIQLQASQKAVFNAGTTFNIHQRAKAAIIQVAGTSSVSFISPKSLLLAIEDNTGNPTTATAGIFSGPGTVSLNNSSIKTWDGSNSLTTNEAGDNAAQFGKMVVKGGVATLTDLNNNTSVSPIVSRKTRELQTVAIPVGTMAIQYVDQNGKKIGSPVKLDINDKNNYIGQYIPLNSSFIAKYAADGGNMPENYMWAIGNQVFSGAKADMQSGGDSLPDDDGDQYGQATIGIVPMQSQPGQNNKQYDHIYNIYVFGVPQKLQYQYVDINHKDRGALTTSLSGKTGIEGSRGITTATANYGNTINWTDSSYTKDNVPAGYHYYVEATGQGVQPKSTLVGTENPLVTIYVEGNQQTITPTYVNKDGIAVQPIQPITVSSKTGDVTEIPKAPDVKNYAFDHVEVNGKEVPAGSTFIMANGTDSIKYVYHSLDQEKTTAINDINSRADDAITAVNGNVNLTTDEKTKQKDAINAARNEAIDKINNAELQSEVDKAYQDGIAKIEAAKDPGTPLAKQKDDAIDTLKDEATKAKAAIANDPTLTAAKKEEQTKAVDQALATAIDNVNNAPDADAVNKAKDDGINTIRAIHKSGDSLEDQRAAAIAYLRDIIAKNTKDAITNDKTLTTSEKNEQIQAVNAALTEAIANINSAPTADSINSARDAGQAAIEAAYQSNKVDLNGQKAAAKQDLDDYAKQIKNDIDGDETLTAAEKAKQKGDVDSALAAAKTNIDNATDADGVIAAHDEGKKNIKAAHQLNKLSLQQQKDNSKSDIDKVAQEVKNEIDGDPTLTNAEKASQKAKVDSDAQKAKAAIDNATDAQGVVDAHDAGVDQIRKDHQPNTTTLEEQKQNAKDAIDAEAVKIKGEIENDPTLTNAEKTAQKNKVDRDAAAAKDNIDAATNAQGIVDARDQGKKVIDGDHVTSDTPLSDQKQNAKDAIDNEAIKIKGEIDADPTLTSAEKAEQKAKVDADAQTAKDNIDDATDAQGVKDAQRAGIKAIDKDHVSGTSLDDQKQAAKAKIDKEAKDTKSLINSDPTLTDAEKTAQKAKVDADAVAAKDAIDKATTAQGVIGVTNDGINTIDADYQPSDATLDQQRQAAKDRIDEEADKIKGWINKDPSLDSKAKADQIAAVDAAAIAAKNKIDAATNAQGIKAARDKGIIDIDSKYLTNPMSLVDQKKYAQQLIRDEAEIVKEEINSDPVLDDQTKKDQIAAVEAQMQKAIDKIEAAATAQQVQEEYTNGVNVLHAQHLSGNDLATQKQSAKDALVQEANTIKAIIAADTALDDDEKATQTANVEGELEKAENAVDRAKNSQEISDREVAGINAIDAQYVPGKTLDDQKAEANKAIDEAATAAKASIDAAKNLTNPEKAKAKQAVDDAANAAKDNVDAATDSEGIEKAQTDGIDAINAVVKDSSAVELTAVKENAKKAIDAEAAAINQAITNDQNLTPSEKARQSSNVQLEAQKAKNAIDRAEDAQEVKDKENAGIDAIDAQYIPGKPLDQQKADISSEIDAAAANAKDAIDKDTGKTAAEKAKEKQAVDDAAATAKDAINKAENAGDVNKAKEDGLAGIAAAKKPNITLDDQKAAAKDAIDKAANDAKNKISQDLELTPDDKKAANKAIDDAVAAAKDKVDQATNADQVSQVVADVTNEIGKVITGTDDTKSKNTVKDSIKDHGDSAKKDVDALPNLSDADKQAIKDKIDQAVAAGTANVDTAKTISEMLQAANDAMATIDSIVKDNSGSGSNGSDSNGSDSNGSGSNGSDSNGSGSNGSESNGSDSNGSGSNGSESNGSGSNGSDSNGSESNGSDSNGSGSNESDSNGSGSNGSDSNGSDSNGSGSNGSESNGSDSNGSESNGSESNGSDSNGSDSNGSGSNGSGSNGSDSNGSGSNGSESNGSDSNGSESNGSGSNDSDSNGSESNGSGSNGSDSNGSGSNGSESNGSESNGSDSNGSESNGSGSNGSDSNGSGSNGSDSNGSESNGSDSNGSGSNGSDSNGSGSNGSDSNGSDSNGSESNGSGSNGSDSNGSESNGSESNGSGSNGSESNGSGSNGSESNGSGSNGSESNGSDSNGSGSNGSDSNGSESNGSGSNGSESNGSDSNGSGSNGSDSNGSESNGSGSNGSDSNGSGSNGSESNGSGSNGSGSNGSESNGSDSNGTGSNGSGSNGSDSNGSGSNGSDSNGSGSNGSESNGSDSNGSGSNGSSSNGSDSNGSGSNGSESNGSGSNGSDSNGSSSNGSESNGSGSNGSESNGSESNGSGSNGSSSNGSDSNGSSSNGSDSNGSGSNGSESNGSGSNGSDSNGSSSNGSDSNGSGSNGSESNGSESNGSGSNGSGSNGSESNGSGSNGSESNGSDSNGSGSNGSESNGSGSNGSDSNGTGSNGSGSNGSESNGSGSNGSESNGSGSNGSGSNGSSSNGSDSNGSESNGSGSNGSDSNGSESNGSESNGSGSNGSESNGSGSNGSESNGSSSNGSDSNGSGSNGSESNGSGSNGSNSNGSDSNGSESNGSGSNGSESNDSDSNGSGSNGSGSNGSDSNGSGSNGSESNGSESNGSDSNGSGSNGSESNGSGSNGSGSNGSDSNGSGSNGSESNGSGSNGSDSNGSGSNGSESNGSESNGSGSNGSDSNGSESNGSESNGSNSNGSGSNGSGSNGSESNGSDSNGSGSNGSESNGSGSNGSESNGSGSNGSGSNGSESNGSESNGSGSNGSESNGSGSNGSESNGSGSNGSGSNGSDSNGSGSNGSESNGSDSNGSGSNGSESNGSESNGSGSNGSGSNGSGSNGSESNGSGSNGSGSNGSESNGSESNGSGSNGSESNGSGSNGSESNGSGSNGSGSNGSDSNGSGSNGSGSNGSDSNGSGSNGSESNGSESNGSGSNGSESNGSGSNGSGSNGSGSNGSESNGSESNGSESNGSGSNGSDSNGSGSNGSGSNGSDSNGSGSNGSSNSGSNNSSNAGTGSAGSGVNASGSNGSATSEGTSAETAGADASKAVDKTLTHNAYFYDKNGNRANLLVAKKGSTISTFGTEKIGNRDFYLTDDGLYVAVNNFIGKKRTLKKNAFVYNKNGKRVGTKLLKKNAKVTTYGDPVSINGKSYFIIDNNRYVKAANFASAAKEANNVLADGVTSNATLGHDAYIYNGNGQRVNKVILKSGSQVTTGETKTVNGRQFVEIGKDQYLDSDNVTGTTRTLTSSAAVYNKYGKRVGSKTINKGENVQTFGSVVAIQGVAYYSIGNDEFVKQTAFE